MMKHSDFVAGKKYEYFSCGSYSYYYCVGHDVEGYALIQRINPYSKDISRVSFPDAGWREYKEPVIHKFWLVFWKNKTYPQMQVSSYPQQKLTREGVEKLFKGLTVFEIREVTFEEKDR